jgi:hypothetical protein
MHLQGFLARQKPSPPLQPPHDPSFSPTAGSYGVAFSWKRGSRERAQKNVGETFIFLSERLWFSTNTA